MVFFLNFHLLLITSVVLYIICSIFMLCGVFHFDIYMCIFACFGPLKSNDLLHWVVSVHPGNNKYVVNEFLLSSPFVTSARVCRHQPWARLMLLRDNDVAASLPDMQ